MKAKPTILSPPWMLTAITRLKSGDDLMSRLTWIIIVGYILVPALAYDIIYGLIKATPSTTLSLMV
jgi:hypothetical protein